MRSFVAHLGRQIEAILPRRAQVGAVALPHLGTADASCCRQRQSLPLLLPGIGSTAAVCLLPQLAGGACGSADISPRILQQACQLIQGQAGPGAPVVVAWVELQHAVPRFGRRPAGWWVACATSRPCRQAAWHAAWRDRSSGRAKLQALGRARRAYAATIDSVSPVPMTTRSNSEGSMGGAVSMLLFLRTRCQAGSAPCSPTAADCGRGT